VATDLILDPAEKYDGVTAYCVEQARWSKREAEDHTKFVPAQEFRVKRTEYFRAGTVAHTGVSF
jgi:hypothetical protein